MDIEGAGWGILGVLALALFIAGYLFSSGTFYVIGGIVTAILIAALFFGGEGSMSILNFGR